MLDWSLLHGAFPVAAGVAGALAMVALLWPRGRARRWWLRSVPLALACAVLVAALVAVLSRTLLAEPLPRTVTAWFAGALAGTTLAVAAGRAGARWLPVVAAALVVALAAASGVNHYYGEVPTVRTALGLGYADELEMLPARTARLAAPADWSPPAGMPATGRVVQVDIPGLVSGFDARPGWVYLPPAYLGSVRAELPVLVLLAGQPGGPSDWLDGGQLASRMDRYAAAHQGLAPVVVMPDDLGSELADPLCLDSALGNAATYLGVDVPNWISHHLQAGAGRAVGGLSYGGTCALQLALTVPSVYPTFIDISGETPPALPTTRHYPATAGAIVVGAQDREFHRDAMTVLAALRAAAVPATFTELPGSHTWGVWGPGLESTLPWLDERLGLTR